MTVEHDEVEEVDVVVVGSGAAGLTAAVTAALRGLSVVVVEKTGKYGGTTCYSGGVIWVPNNPLLKRLSLNWFLRGVGAADSFDKARDYLQAVVGDRVPAERREAFLHAGPAMLTELGERAGMRWRHWTFPDYYAESPGGIATGRSIEPDIFDGRKLGAELANLREPSPVLFSGITLTGKEGIGLSFGLSGPRGPVSGAVVLGRWLKSRVTGAKPISMGRSLVAHLRHAMLGLQVPLWLNTQLVELLSDDPGAAHPRVTGVRVIRDGTPVTIRARGGVVLATGGFSQSQELREKYLPAPSSTEWTLVPKDGQDGDAVTLGGTVGAAMDLMDRAWGFPTVMLPDKTGTLSPSLAFFEKIRAGVIIVNGQGERYFDEGMPYEPSWAAMYADDRPESQTVPSWLLFDQRAKNRYAFFMAPPRVPFPKRWLRNSDIVKAASIAELAQRTGLPADKLTATISRFNGHARAGFDEDFQKGETAFSRFFGDQSLPHPNLAPLEQAPYYAVRLYPGDISTKGGLVTDVHARVVHEDGSVIEGLYASGNCSASVMGEIYPGGGGTLSPAMVFGYIAAGHIAATQSTAPQTTATQAAPTHVAGPAAVKATAGAVTNGAAR